MVNIKINHDFNHKILIDEKNEDRRDLIPKIGILNGKEKLLEYKSHNLKDALSVFFQKQCHL